MTTRLQKTVFSAVVALLVVAMTVTGAQALKLGNVLKLGGIAFLVDTYRKPIDKQINKTLGERKAQAMGATKVVAILSVGSGGYIGAAQVVGSPDYVQQTQAVIQAEINAGSFKATGLIPVSRKTVSGNPERIKGVGVSAVIDFKI
jgi:hypothetical protein